MPLPAMPVGWNWKNSMSCSGIPLRNTIAAPSPVNACAFEVTEKTRPWPPVANNTALAWNACSSPVWIWQATTPVQRPSLMITSTTWYSSKNVTSCLMHCW